MIRRGRSEPTAFFYKIFKVWCSYIYNPCDPNFFICFALALTVSEITTLCIVKMAKLAKFGHIIKFSKYGALHIISLVI